MKVSILDLHCLNAVCDDFETLPDIAADVRKSSHGNVSDQDVAACLIDLARDGFVALYAYDPTSGSYVPRSAAPPDLAGTWIAATAAGRRELDTHWVED
jgi:hypothetical protein